MVENKSQTRIAYSTTLFVGMFQVMIAVGSLFGGIVVDHYNESTLIYSVLPCLVFAIAPVLLHFFRRYLGKIPAKMHLER